VLDVAWEETDSSPEEMWVITAQGRLARLNKQGDQWSQAELLQQKYCPASALIARAEDLYLGPSDANQAQLYIFDKQQQWATSQPLKFPEESRLQVKDLTLDKATQALWVGTTVGLYWVSNNQSSSSIYPASDTTEYLWVEALAMDDEDTLWIGTGNQGLFRFNPVTNKWSQLNGLPSKRITSISLSASNKTALVGTDNGLGVCQWNNESVYHCSNVNNLNIQHEVDAISLTPDGVSMIGTSDQLVVINDLITLAK
jgi:ligand-binding sensor domain-containing protein